MVAMLQKPNNVQLARYFHLDEQGGILASYPAAGKA